MFERIYIIGVGLLGSSLGMNLISKKIANEVIGVGRDETNLKIAQRRKAIHRYAVTHSKHNDFDTRIEFTSQDLVVLAAPVQTNLQYLKRIPSHVLVMDVGSVKGDIVTTANHLKKRLVGCHPIAGTEKTGAASGDKNLFKDRFCIMTPSKHVTSSDVACVKKVWGCTGARVQVMTPQKHDALFALTSHLPHVLAYTLMSVAVKKLKRSDWDFVFTSFRDATRVAGSSAEMWADIFVENKKEVLNQIRVFKKQLSALELLISKENKKALLAFLQSGQKDYL